ncbi:YezD family protein [Paenibacillus sp. BC26]|uniref:YezD family protein n=1 Tax=Paenibacillus sp. BC26 TaxID=1881032 RepID=UPI0008E05610|nr:YezD family protein [Paenibacillus sp. BC26]SFT05098.1 hypothetical protein SAMN05428962_3993 [Paenibacillus sp. BC26]
MTKLIADEIWLNRIQEQVNGLEYGSVQITVHNGTIVQIERTDRQRFENSSSGSKKQASSNRA